MTHTALAIQWRPKSFSEVIGQPLVIQALTNAIEQNKLHHAYIFTGTRGVGKTTLARLFAKSLSCQQAIQVNTCGQCDACLGIDSGQFVDVIEVDAASRTRVEDTRALLDNIPYAPNSGRFKIYIIDEVHMLSTHSFNALLKTLEEPPAHVKFLLATTDPQKIPVTVLSRCLQFHLRPISNEQIQNQLNKVATAQGSEIEPAAISKVAQAADGSLRDGMSLLEQVLALSTSLVTCQEVEALLGLTSAEALITLLQLVESQSGATLLDNLNKLDEAGPDYSRLLSDLQRLLYQISLLQLVPESTIYQQEFSAQVWPVLQALAKKLTPEMVQLYYQITLNGQHDLQYAPDAKIGFQMLLLRMLTFDPVFIATTHDDDNTVSDTPNNTTPPANSVTTPISGSIEKPTGPAAAVQSSQRTSQYHASNEVKNNTSANLGGSSQGNKSNNQPVTTKTTARANTTNNTTTISTNAHTTNKPHSAQSAGSQDISSRLNPWTQCALQLPLKGMAKELAHNITLSHSENNTIYFSLCDSKGILLNDRNQQKIQQALSTYLNITCTVVISTGASPTQHTPAAAKASAQSKAEQQALEQAKQNPGVQQLIDTFDAKLVVEIDQPS